MSAPTNDDDDDDGLVEAITNHGTTRGIGAGKIDGEYGRSSRVAVLHVAQRTIADGCSWRRGPMKNGKLHEWLVGEVLLLLRF